MISKYQLFEAALVGSKDTSLRWHSQVLSADNHMNTPSGTIHNALQFIFEPLRLDPESDIAQQGVAAIKAYYDELSKNLYGYEVLADSGINSYGYHLMRSEDKLEQALEVFRTNVQWHPRSALAHDGLAAAYLRNKEYEKALEMADKAISLMHEQSNDMRYYQLRKKRIEKAKAKASNQS